MKVLAASAALFLLQCTANAISLVSKKTLHAASTERVGSLRARHVEVLRRAVGRQQEERDVAEHQRAFGEVARRKSKHSAEVVDRSRTRAKVRTISASEVGIVHKTEYWGQIFVGSSSQKFSVIFDTGSGNLILPSTSCGSLACQAHTRYDPSQSSSSVRVGKHGQPLQASPSDKKESTVKFGTGKIHGQFYQDNVCLAPNTACMKASFIGTDQETDSPFLHCNFDGIMGLGFKDLSMGPGFNMVDDISMQHSLRKDQFSVFLAEEGGSEITFGGFKSQQAASKPLWAPVTRQSYWQIGIDDLTFNNMKTGLCSKCQVAVDTGTSLLAGPSDVVERLSTQLDVQEDCSNFEKLPWLGFAIGDRVLNLKPDDYVDKDANSCSLALMSLDVPPPKGPLFIFGDPFLRRFLTIYDRDGPKVGFAVAQHGDLSATDATQLISPLRESTPVAATQPSTSSFPKEAMDHSSMPAVTSESNVVDSVSFKPTDVPLYAGDMSDPLKAVDSEELSWPKIVEGAEGASQVKQSLGAKELARPAAQWGSTEEVNREAVTDKSESDGFDSEVDAHLRSLSNFRRRWEEQSSKVGMLQKNWAKDQGKNEDQGDLVSIPLVRRLSQNAGKKGAKPSVKN